MQTDFEQIKRSTDIVAVLESLGVKLKKVWRNHIGLCPFHDDANPSLVVTQINGLFRCPVCGATGNVIQFVAKLENISDKEAAQKLLHCGLQNADCGMKDSPIANPQSEVRNGAALLKRVIGFYAKTLRPGGTRDRAGYEYLKSRNLADVAVLGTFHIGYCNGSLRWTCYLVLLLYWWV